MEFRAVLSAGPLQLFVVFESVLFDFHSLAGIRLLDRNSSGVDSAVLSRMQTNLQAILKRIVRLGLHEPATKSFSVCLVSVDQVISKTNTPSKYRLPVNQLTYPQTRWVSALITYSRQLLPAKEDPVRQPAGVARFRLACPVH